MRRLAIALVALLGAAPAAAAVPQQMKVELIASTLAPRPGSTVLVGFRMVPKPGWHGYWSNAGGSGIAPTVSWSAPAGVKFGPLLHPAPSLFKSLGVVSYVHSGEHVLVSRMRVPAGIALGTAIQVQADLNFAVCSDRLCVPGQGTFSLPMVAGSGASSEDAGPLDRALAHVPASVAGGSYWRADRNLTLALPDGARLRATATRFFPDDNGFFDGFAARASDGTSIRIVTPMTGSPPARITGVVTDGASSYRLSLPRGLPVVQAETKPETAAAVATPSNEAAPTALGPAISPSSAAHGRMTASQSLGPVPGAVAAVSAIAAALLLVAFARRSRP